MNIRKIVFGLAGLAILGTAAPSQAITVTQNGADYTVSVLPTASPTVWRFTYLADFDGFTNATAQAYITGINVKVENATPTAVSVISAPVGAGGTTAWSAAINSNLNSSSAGCGSPQGGNAFTCVGISLAGDLLDLPTSGNPKYTWVFDVTFTSALTAAMITNVNNPIRAQFVRNNNGDLQFSQMSLNGPFQTDCIPGTPNCTPPDRVPEPGTLALLGLGLLGLGLSRRKQNA